MDAHTTEAERWEPAATVTPLPSAGPPKNLPSPLTSFVGRERELAELGKVLANTRLLTLTGAGGCGKTRLALQAASETLEGFPGGAWWVELASLGEQELVGAAIATALGVRPLPGMTPLQAAAACLGPRRAMVILDNCEHLREACAEAAEALLQAGSEVVVLATSRAPLGAAGETDWRVPSLSLSTDQDAHRDPSLAGSDAVQLFVERARNSRPSFTLTDENEESVAAICITLDGLPLAIELAAARMRMLSAEQIAAGVSDRFKLLTGGPRTAPPRLQALRASVDWSHDLLSDQERALLRRLAVFAGGFTLGAAEEVCADDEIERDAVLDLLASLVDQSLVIAEERDHGVRYRQLETVREYTLERLAEAGEEPALRTRHRDHFLALAEQAGPQFETSHHRERLEILDPEAANLAAAIEHALRSDPPRALRFCAALYRWWCARGRFAEAELAHARSLEACDDAVPGLRARVFESRAWVASNSLDFDAAESHATEALALAEGAGDPATAARARCELGLALVYADPRAGRAELDRAAELAREAGDEWAFVAAKQLIAMAYMFQSDHRQFAKANDEVSSLAERLGDPFQVARRWVWVGWMACVDGPFEEVRDSAERIRGAVHGIGEPVMESFADFELAIVEVWEGDAKGALERLERRLEQALKLGVGLAIAPLSTSIAFANLAAGRPDQMCGRLEGLLPLIEGRDNFVTAWAWCFLAQARRLLGDEDGAESAAIQARASGERIDNRFLATLPRLTLGRLAAARGEWGLAREHALAHLDACVEGGHITYVPGCLDALGEVAAGVAADEDAVRLFAAAQRARDEMAVVRVPPEEDHWSAMDIRLREALGDERYEAVRAQAAELSTDDALEWVRRARGPRRRPPGGWESLTPTEVRVVELVAEGLTNPEIAERMFISSETVKTHVSHVFKKLDVGNRAELSARAAERGNRE